MTAPGPPEMTRPAPLPPPVRPTPVRGLEQLSWHRRAGTVHVAARLAVTADDPYLAGHFPGLTMLPGVFLIEAVCRAVGAALSPDGAAGELLEVRSARFLAPMLGGEVISLVIDATEQADPPAGPPRVDVEASGRNGSGVRTAQLRLVVTGPAGAA